MTFQDLLKGIEYTLLSGDASEEITGLCRDNRKAKAGDLFICTKGARFDTHDETVVRELFEKGVRCFVAERPLNLPGASVALVSDTRREGAKIYSTWYGHPEKEMIMIGITGSKGKTTTAHMLRSLLQKAGKTVGLIGTNGAEYPGCCEELANTTPDYDELEKHLRLMKNAGCEVCILEVSSQAILKYRVNHILFQYAVWLNLQEGDHVGPNEHASFEEYLICKASLLAMCQFPIVYGDDPYTSMTMVKAEMAAAKAARRIRFLTFGSYPYETYHASGIEPYYSEEERRPGMKFHVTGPATDTDVLIGFPGDFSEYNALAAIVVAKEIGVPDEIVKDGMWDVPIRGRDELVYRGDFTVCVDFAHNGASAFGHLTAVRAYRPKRVVCVFGADGNRSKGRRYGMGEAAGKLADFSIVTSGHNRFETFEAILEDTKVGLHKAEHPNYIAIRDREEAIRYAIDHAESGDFITILGLGHEHWQEEAGVKRVYNDSDFVRSVLREKGLID